MHYGDYEDIIRKKDALMRFHYKQEPDNWTDDIWAARWEELQWVLSKQ